MKEYTLTPDELSVEETAGEFRAVGKEKKARIEKILDKERKDRAISLRIRSFDLELLKVKAEEEGVPYQTLITIVLRKYVTGRFYEKEEVRKLLDILAAGKA